jgi:UDP-N-acetylmuramoyl-tripeptide--D-alanyl-D-alanine ligase
MVAPDVVAITTVGPVHVENFPDGEIGVARAKAEIFAGLAPGGTAILNADDRWFDLLRGEAIQAGARILTFGASEDCDAELLTFAATETGARVTARIGGQTLFFPLRQSGYHWGPNSLTILLMLAELGVDRQTALRALSTFEPLEGRGAARQVHLLDGQFTLIDESYNANPLSVGAALRTLGARPARGRRIVALTDMLELGDESPKRHAELAEAIEAARIDLVFCAGPLMQSLWEALSPTRRGGYALEAAELEPRLARAVEPGDVVMVKGSRDSKAQALAKALMALDVSAGKVG